MKASNKVIGQSPCHLFKRQDEQLKVLLTTSLLSQVGDKQYLNPWPAAKLRKETKFLLLSGLEMQ